MPTAMVAYTITGCSALGSMCRKMMRMRPKPSARAASTYSSSTQGRKLARTMRQMPSQPVSPSTRITEFTLWPKIVATATARMM